MNKYRDGRLVSSIHPRKPWFWEFEAKDYVCEQCGSDDFHTNIVWFNREKSMVLAGESLRNEVTHWCVACEETSIVPANIHGLRLEFEKESE
jgi:hypothetical protein